MNFLVQSSRPQNSSEFCIDDKKISEAIETIFPMMTEDALLVWDTSYIPLSYKYDISYMIEDILHMLKSIRENPKGQIKIAWPTNSFACNWTLTWGNEILIINSKWRPEPGNPLDNLSELKINILAFTYEWKMVLRILIENLEICGYNKNNLKDMNMLYDEFQSIKCYGLLYK